MQKMDTPKTRGLHLCASPLDYKGNDRVVLELAGSCHYHLAQGGVAVDGACHLLDGHASVHGSDSFLDEVGGVWATDVASHYCEILAADDELYHSVGLAHSHRLSVATEERLGSNHLDTLILALLLGESHHSELGCGEHGTWHYVELHVALLAQDMS